MASTPPKRDSTEAACEDVLEGCKLGPDDEKCLQAMQDVWQSRTTGLDLLRRLTDYRLILLERTAFMSLAQRRLTAPVPPATWPRSWSRFCKLAERNFLNELGKDPQAGVRIWLEHVLPHLETTFGTPVLLAWHYAVEKVLLGRLRVVALSNVRLRGNELNAAINVVSNVIINNLELYVAGVEAGIANWHPPPEKFDRMLTFLSGGSAGAGGLGSGLTAWFAPAPAAAAGTAGATGTVGAAGAAVAGAPVAFYVGLTLVAAGAVLGVMSAIRNEKAAEDAAEEDQVVAQVGAGLRRLGQARADSLKRVLDFLAPGLLAGAVTAGVDVSGRTQGPLYTFVWECLFPEVPEGRVAAAAYFTQAFDASVQSAPH